MFGGLSIAFLNILIFFSLGILISVITHILNQHVNENFPIELRNMMEVYEYYKKAEIVVCTLEIFVSIDIIE